MNLRQQKTSSRRNRGPHVEPSTCPPHAQPSPGEAGSNTAWKPSGTSNGGRLTPSENNKPETAEYANTQQGLPNKRKRLDLCRPFGSGGLFQPKALGVDPYVQEFSFASSTELSKHLGSAAAKTNKSEIIVMNFKVNAATFSSNLHLFYYVVIGSFKQSRQP